jgi:deoxycytidine triphosphate deaminase
MPTLSDKDIRKELGINILIYPFHEGNLKGASYNLTPSKLAWKLSNGAKIYDKLSNKIIIPVGETALIETYETIWISKKISGTYHSRVTQVSKGTGHIGTTLDPNYIGPSLLAVHNHSKTPIELIPEKAEFITLVFQYLLTESSREHGNSHGRKDILSEVGIRLTAEDAAALDQPYMINPERLKQKLEECPDYQKIKREREEEAKRLAIESTNKAKNHFSRNLYMIFVGSILVLVLFSVYLQSNQKQLGNKPWYPPINYFINTVIPVLSSALTALITVDLTRKIQ